MLRIVLQKSSVAFPQDECQESIGNPQKDEYLIGIPSSWAMTIANK